MKRICICGGGSQGHISAGVIGSNPNYTVDILTRRPKEWVKDFVTIDLTGKEYHARLNTITDDPSEVIPKADIVYVCVPGNAISSVLKTIKSYISPNTIIGSPFGGSGFFLQAFAIIGTNNKYFSLQRVPYTGRPRVYGHSATLKGYKPYLKVATYNIDNPDEIATMIEDWYSTKTYTMDHFLDATLSNSNPLLHPSRMYVMFKDWTPEKIYDRIPYLYNTEWDDESSKCWVDCDNELRQIIEKLPFSGNEIPSLFEYYECDDIKSLTKKMQSIEPFKTVQAHMIEVNGGYKVDPTVRYFTEDIPYGMLMIKAFGELTGVETPTIDRVIHWAEKVMNTKFLEGNRIDYSSLDPELSFLSQLNLKNCIK